MAKEPDWQAWAQRLEAADEAEADDLVDELSDTLLARVSDPSATIAARASLRVARSDLSIQSAAVALSYAAADDDNEVALELKSIFSKHRPHPFLGPVLLTNLGIFGLRNDLARLEAQSQLLQLAPEDSRYLLVAGAKIIGLLCDRENLPPLRQKLFSMAEHKDPAIRAECLQQMALLLLADAMLAESNERLLTQLASARDTFARAESAEEFRPDAKLFRLLLDAVLQFGEVRENGENAVDRISQISAHLREMGGPLAHQFYSMNRSPAAEQIAERCADIATCLESATREMSEYSSWTNFDLSVVNLAECFITIRYRPEALTGNKECIRALSSISDKVLKPRLGGVLALKVGRDSLSKVIRTYVDNGGNEGIVEGLKALQEAAREAEKAGNGQIPSNTWEKLSTIAASAECTLEEFAIGLQEALGKTQPKRVEALFDFLEPLLGEMKVKPTIGIIVALDEEFTAIRLMIQNEKRHQTPGTGGGREYLIGDIPSSRGGVHRVVIAQTSDVGNNSATLKASKLLHAFDGIEGIIMCGVAGGAPNPEKPVEHVRLGDIVVSNRYGVVQYDFGKDKRDSFEVRSPPRPPSAMLLQAVQILEQDKKLGQRSWQDYIREAMASLSIEHPDPKTDVFLNAVGEQVDHPEINEPRPRIILGAIASSNSVQGDFEKRDALRDKHKVRAIEMEGSGVADATWEYERAGYLVVRGICDYCDVRTKEFQTDDWKQYAAIIAAAYVRAMIEVIPAI